MTPHLRRLAFTAHITLSIGWLGAVAGFLALSVAGLTSRDAEVVRAAYLAMDMIGRFVIVPMSLAALATGLLPSLGHRMGPVPVLLGSREIRPDDVRHLPSIAASIHRSNRSSETRGRDCAGHTA